MPDESILDSREYPVTVKFCPTLKLAPASVTLPTVNALYATNSRTSPLVAAVVNPTVEPSEAS